VTAMSYASSLLIKEKEIQKKRNIKSRKIDKRKRKILVFKVFHNNEPLLEYAGSMMLRLLSRRFKKFLSFSSKA